MVRMIQFVATLILSSTAEKKENGMRARRILIGAAAALLVGLALAQGAVVKVGVALTYSGVGSQLGTQIDRGIELFISENPDAFGGHGVELIKRDLQGPGGDAVTNAVQDLIAREGVDILAGFAFSPNAIAAAPMLTEAKVPMVLMGGSAAWIPQLSPYIVRVSFSTWHAAYPMGRYAHDELGCRRGAVGYTDFSAGRDSGRAFRTGLEAAGGTIVEEIAMGRADEVPDFTPFLQRVNDATPDCFYVFVPAGPHNLALLEAYVESGMKDREIRLIGPGALTQVFRLREMGDAMVGLMSMHHYSADYDTPANCAFVAAWKRAYGEDATPDFMGVGGWDGMAAIAHATREQDGAITAAGTMKALAGWRYESPRGAIMIDPETRDIVHDQNVHEVVPGDTRPVIRVVHTVPQVRDPCKALGVGRCEGPR